jgi:hypothetical protein
MKWSVVSRRRLSNSDPVRSFRRRLEMLLNHSQNCARSSLTDNQQAPSTG